MSKIKINIKEANQPSSSARHAFTEKFIELMVENEAEDNLNISMLNAACMKQP